MIRGSAVPTMDWSSAARNMPAIRPAHHHQDLAVGEVAVGVRGHSAILPLVVASGNRLRRECAHPEGADHLRARADWSQPPGGHDRHARRHRGRRRAGRRRRDPHADGGVAVAPGDRRADRCCSSARTSSAPGRSRSAAPTCGCPGSARRSAPAASSPRGAGNHAQGVALAAQMLGIRATVFMPEGAPIPKANATRGYGAEVRFHGEYLTQALVAAQEFADETGAVLIHPFDHTDIVAGQGTAGLEILAAGPRGRDRAGADRRRRAARRHRHRDQGAAARRTRRRRAGRGGRGLPRVAAAGRAGGAGADDHDGRRHRGRAARATCRSRRSRSTSTTWSPSRRSRCRGRWCCCSSGPRWWSSRPARPPSPRCWTSRRRSPPRSSPCSPAATSTRCCSAT